MAGTWAGARAQIQQVLDGLTVDLGVAWQTEQMTAFEYAPPGRQPADLYPYCFILPQNIKVDRFPGNMRKLRIDVGVRVLLAPVGQVDDINALHRRYDSWWSEIADAWDPQANLNENVDISVEQEFSGLALFDDVDQAWGFDMILGEVQISENKAFTAGAQSDGFSNGFDTGFDAVAV